jgi:hypothetical protein
MWSAFHPSSIPINPMAAVPPTAIQQSGSEALSLSTDPSKTPTHFFNPTGVMVGRMDLFSGSQLEDVDEFLGKFDMWVAANHLDDVAKTMALYSCLSGAARTWFDALDETQRTDYKTLRAALKTTFLRAGKQYILFKQLIERKQAVNESLDFYAFAMKLLFKKANKDMTENERLIYFTQGLQPHLQAHVITQGCSTFEAAVEAARKREAALIQIGTIQDLSVNSASTPTSQSDQASKLQQLIDRIHALEQREDRPAQVDTLSLSGSNTSSQGQVPFQGRGNYYGNQHCGNFRGNHRGGFSRGRGGQNFRVPMTNYRTAEGLVICRNCQRVGHISSGCPEQHRENWQQNRRDASFQARQEARQDNRPQNSTGSNNSTRLDPQPHTSTQGQSR